RSPQFVASARALENHVFYAATDRVGTERGWKFIGRSKVVDCNGDTLVEAGPDAEELFVVLIEFQQAHNNRIANLAGSYELHRVGDRRPEFYKTISEPAHQPVQAVAASSND